MRARASSVSLPGMHRARGRDFDRRLRVLIVDQHEVYRAACAALLRTEGLDVLDAGPGDDIDGLARALEPDVVLIDVAPPVQALRDAVRELGSLPSAPAVLLISSAEPERLERGLDGCLLVAKADVCAREILRLAPGAADGPGAQPEPW